jgi:hypothetical protein
MQQLFDDHYPSLGIGIIGVNEFGFDGNNQGFSDGRDIPWLQDTDSNSNGVSDVWYDSWNVEYRDVIIVDEANDEMERYNVTTFNLATPENFETLRDLFIEHAVVPPETEWQAPIEKLDVDANGFVAARDALLIINQLALNTYPGGTLPPLNGMEPASYYDTTGDGSIAGQDALLIVNHLIVVNNSTDSAPLLMIPPLAGQVTAIQGVATAVPMAPTNEIAPVLADAESKLAETDDRMKRPAAVDRVLETWEHDSLFDAVEVERSEATDIQEMIDTTFANLR